MSPVIILENKLNQLVAEIEMAKSNYERSKTKANADNVNVLIGKAKEVISEMSTLCLSA